MDRYQIFIERHVREKTYICILILLPILLSFYDNPNKSRIFASVLRREIVQVIVL